MGAPGARAHITLDTKTLDRIAAKLNTNTSDFVHMMALTCMMEVLTHFSRESPSAPGEPPGVDTGTLKSSINVNSLGPTIYAVNVGTDYGIHLEYGTIRMAARPFLLPAVMRTAQWLKMEGAAAKVIKA